MGGFYFSIYPNLWIIEIIGDQTISWTKWITNVKKKKSHNVVAAVLVQIMQGKLQSCAMVWGPSIINKLSHLRES